MATSVVPLSTVLNKKRTGKCSVSISKTIQKLTAIFFLAVIPKYNLNLMDYMTVLDNSHKSMMQFYVLLVDFKLLASKILTFWRNILRLIEVVSNQLSWLVTFQPSSLVHKDFFYSQVLQLYLKVQSILLMDMPWANVQLITSPSKWQKGQKFHHHQASVQFFHKWLTLPKTGKTCQMLTNLNGNPLTRLQNWYVDGLKEITDQSMDHLPSWFTKMSVLSPSLFESRYGDWYWDLKVEI